MLVNGKIFYDRTIDVSTVSERDIFHCNEDIINQFVSLLVTIQSKINRGVKTRNENGTMINR